MRNKITDLLTEIGEDYKKRELAIYKIHQGHDVHIFYRILPRQTKEVVHVQGYPGMSTESEFISPVIKGMEEEGNPFVGILYLGGILVDGNIFAIEYNARHGDPEIQVYLSGVENYFSLVNACLDGKLDKIKIKDDSKTRVCVVGASRGYPDDYSQVKGKRIYGLEKAMKIPGVLVFIAGVDVEGKRFYTDGGRLFSIVAEGRNILEAKQKAYSAMGCISVEGNNLHYRTDIAWRDVERVLK